VVEGRDVHGDPDRIGRDREGRGVAVDERRGPVVPPFAGTSDRLTEELAAEVDADDRVRALGEQFRVPPVAAADVEPARRGAPVEERLDLRPRVRTLVFEKCAAIRSYVDWGRRRTGDPYRAVVPDRFRFGGPRRVRVMAIEASIARRRLTPSR